MLTTDVDPYDALSACYLEGQRGTGVLITPPTSFGADAAAAMRLEGVQTVYILGGSLAMPASTISTLLSALSSGQFK